MITIFKCNICGIEHRTTHSIEVHKDAEISTRNEEEVERFTKKLEEYRKQCLKNSKSNFEKLEEEKEHLKTEVTRIKKETLSYNSKHFFKRTLSEDHRSITVLSYFGHYKEYSQKPEFNTYRKIPNPLYPIYRKLEQSRYIICPTCGKNTYIL